MAEQRPRFSAKTYRFNLDQPKMYHLPDWDGYKDPKKLAILRQIVEQYGRDPRIVNLAVAIIKKCGCKPREYKKQAACLLKWVQTQIYYVNEAGERLQSPLYTLKSGIGDCDDLAILLCSFFECIRLPWKLVISANTNNGLVRYHEGDPNFKPLPYSHIYCMVGDRPFTPQKWTYCEPTLEVPLGWDIVATQNDPNARKYLPELGGVTGAFVGGAMADAMEEMGVTKFGKNVALAILTGALVSAGTEILLDYLRASPFYQALVLRKPRPKKKKAK